MVATVLILFLELLNVAVGDTADKAETVIMALPVLGVVYLVAALVALIVLLVELDQPMVGMGPVAPLILAAVVVVQALMAKQRLTQMLREMVV